MKKIQLSTSRLQTSILAAPVPVLRALPSPVGRERARVRVRFLGASLKLGA